MRLLLLPLLLLSLAGCAARPALVTPARVEIVGHSMEPALHRGESVAVAWVPLHAVHVGEIAVYWNADRACYEAHRAYAVGPLGIRTKGDANLWPDRELVTARNYVGIVAE